MINKGESKVIIDYAFKDVENLKIALKVGYAFTEIKEGIINDFLDALESALKPDLDNDKWEIKKNIHKAGFYITKRQWQGKYAIAFQSERSGLREFTIGVVKDHPKTVRIDAEKLKNLLDKEFNRPAKQSNWWEWRQWIDDPYQNWDNEQTLIEMKFQKNKVVSYFREYILRIKNIAEPVIDEAVSINKSV